MAIRYLSSRATGANNGTSWADAYEEGDQVPTLNAGDILYIDGGDGSLLYETILALKGTGTASAPILVYLSDEPGRRGSAIWFGGRQQLLPVHNSTGFTDDAGTKLAHAIRVLGSYIILDGRHWRGIQVHGCDPDGVIMSSGGEGTAANCVVRHVHAYNNGSISGSNGSWNTDGAGIRFAGDNNRYEECEVHDNGQDQCQNYGSRLITNVQFRRNALYNGRSHPSYPHINANFKQHSDAVQISNGPEATYQHTAFRGQQNIIGPGLMQGFILGDQSTDAVVDNVTLHDNLGIGVDHAFVQENVDEGQPETPDGWRVERNTGVIYDAERGANKPSGSFAGNIKHVNMESAGTGKRVKGNNFVNGVTALRGTVSENSGNNLHSVTAEATSTALSGTTENPDFVTPVEGFTYETPIQDWFNANLRPQNSAVAGIGSRIYGHEFLRRMGPFPNYARGLFPKSLLTLADPPGISGTGSIYDDMMAAPATPTGAIIWGSDPLMPNDPWLTMQMDQSDAQQISWGDVYHHSDLAAFSFGMQFRLDVAPPAGQTHRLIYNGYTSSGEQGWTVYFDQATLQIRFRRFRDGAGPAFSTSTGVTIGRVHTIYVTYDGATMRGYLDGVANGTATASTVFMLDGARTTWLFSSGFSNSRPKITAGMVMMLDRVLTPAEIQKLHQFAMHGDRTGQDMAA